MNRLPKGPVKLIVGGAISAALLASFYHLLPLSWFIFCTMLLLVEAWSFFNPYEHDTVSEVVWALSTRPLVPLLFGAGVSWAITSGFIEVSREGLWVALFLGVILGHFFWQRQEDVIQSAIMTLGKMEPFKIEEQKDKAKVMSDVKDIITEAD